MSLADLFRAAEPVFAVRGVHLDLKGTPPTFDRLLRLLEVFAACRYNAVLVEWEDTFPWTADLRFRCETCYTPQQVVAFRDAAAGLGIEVVPLVQCLGHMETPLGPRGYERLREVAHQADVLNPLAEGAGELVQGMVDDVLVAFPELTRFHLGGDEAWSFGTHGDTKAYVEAHGKGALYLHHVEPILDKLNARGVRPILWHDMMKDWPPDALRRLAEKADLCVWGYTGHPDTTEHHYNTKVIGRFAEHGAAMWCATAYKGGGGHNVDLPKSADRALNAAAWAEVARRFAMRGVFATAWSRYSTHNVHSETIDASLDSLVQVAVILHDGEAPAGGIEACAAALEDIGERDRFDACRGAMERLAAARETGWLLVRRLREIVTMATIDARRRTGGIMPKWLAGLTDALAEADRAAAEARRAYAGLVEEIWIDRYLAERVEPLREELAGLEPRVRQLDPAGWAAMSPEGRT